MPTQIELIKKYGLAIRGNLGQNFLIDPNIQKKIVRLLGEPSRVPVLEIGPGLGALTGHLLESGFRVIAIERDQRFIDILRTEYGAGSEPLIEILHGDVLEYDLAEIFKERGHKNPKVQVISNLPYYITAPILFHLVEHRAVITRAVLTLQKEVAARLAAYPGTRDYGRLTLGIRYAADVKQVFDISRSCFTPQPEVDSSTVVLDFHPPAPKKDAAYEAWLFHLIQTAFGQRRKMLMHNLLHDEKVDMTRPELAAIFEKLGLPVNVRGEELLLKDYLALARMIPGRNL
jgi:16S rRNA (adenine1518-N6/adenine1519-N6)-dimethyltransferase